MYSQQKVEELFGKDSLRYLQNKHRGGASNESGNSYENFYAVYKVASISTSVIETQKQVKIYSQCFAFVDDLIIFCEDGNEIQHFQLKNSDSVSWGTGNKSISDDFEKQQILSQDISKSSKLYLVVSNKTLRENLSESCPQNIQKYCQVLYFPYKDKLIDLVKEVPDFNSSIQYLCAFENPEPDKIECVATVLLGAWLASGKSNVSVQEILTNAQNSSPSYIRSFDTTLSLDLEVAQILGNIANFSYNLAKGFLHWQYGGNLETGTVPYRIDHPQFDRFQELVKMRRPATFEDLEVFL